MTENYTYYIEDESGLVPYSYDEICYAVNSDAVPMDKKVLVYDNLTRAKHYCKAKDLLR